jgi:ribonuclease J
MSKKNKLRIIPLGGLGEVGKNMTAYESGKDILIVDTGIMFPENDMLGIDYIIPDFNYLLDRPSAWWGLSSRTDMKTTSAQSSMS